MLSLLLGGTSTGFADTTRIRLTDSLETMERDAFIDCPLESVSYQNKTNNLMVGQTGFIDANYTDTFAENTDLSDLVVLKGTTQIKNEAFQHCPALSSVSILGDLQFIGNHAFNGCSSLASIVLPESLQTIETYAFQGCSNLVEVDVSKITLDQLRK